MTAQQDVTGVVAGIRGAVVLRRGSDGRPLQARATGASVAVSILDEPATRARAVAELEHAVRDRGREAVWYELKAAVKQVKAHFTATHDGFRQAAGVPRAERMTIDDLHAFSVAAGFAFEALGRDGSVAGPRVGIGVMAPAVQDAGKNLIRLVWQSAGYDVVDLGARVAPAEWLRRIEEGGLGAVGVSCMTSPCLDHLERFLGELRARQVSIPVVVGGIAVGRWDAQDLAEVTGVPLHYGADVTDAEAVLAAALRGEAAPAPAPRAVEDEDLAAAVRAELGGVVTGVRRVPVAELVVGESARAGCALCGEDRRRTCTVAMGHAGPATPEAGRALLGRYRSGLLVSARLPDGDDRRAQKDLWMGLLGLEARLAAEAGDALTLMPPIPCPMCPDRDCELAQARCRLPAYRRPLPEAWWIDVAETARRAFEGDRPAGITAVVLVG